MTERITPEELRAFARVMREEGIKGLGSASLSIELGPAPLPPPTDPATLTPDERKAAEKLGRLAVKRVRLKRELGREPKDWEVDGPEALP